MVGEELIVLAEPIAVAALAGGVYALTGYFKNKKQDNLFEGFDLKSFIVTVAGGVIIGGIASYMGVLPDAISSGLIGPFVYQFLRKAVKSLPL